MSIRVKKLERLRALLELYRESNAKPRSLINADELAQRLNLERESFYASLQYLVDEGLAEWLALGGVIGLTRAGANLAEEVSENPQLSLGGFPSASELRNVDAPSRFRMLCLGFAGDKLAQSREVLGNEIRELMSQLEKSGRLRSGEERFRLLSLGRNRVRVAAEIITEAWRRALLVPSAGAELLDTLEVVESAQDALEREAAEVLEMIDLSSNRVDSDSESPLDGQIRLSSAAVSAELGAAISSSITATKMSTEARDRQKAEVLSNEVFIVHGRDDATKQRVARFLEKLGLTPVILHEKAHQGRTLIEKFEAHSSAVAYAVVILSADDVGGENISNPSLAPRARQNVILELGFFMGSLGRAKVCALYDDSVEKPSDIDGFGWIPLKGNWELGLARELRNAGLEVKLDGLI